MTAPITEMWCHKDASEPKCPYSDFSSSPKHCACFGGELPVIKVHIREAKPEDKGPFYYSVWEERDFDGKPMAPAFANCFTWPSQSQVSVCMTYGIEQHIRQYGGGFCKVVVEEVG